MYVAQMCDLLLDAHMCLSEYLICFYAFKTQANTVLDISLKWIVHSHIKLWFSNQRVFITYNGRSLLLMV